MENLEVLHQYHDEFFADISDDSLIDGSAGKSSSQAFFDMVIELMDDNEVLDELPDYVSYCDNKTGNPILSGYIFNREMFDANAIGNAPLSLFVSCYSQRSTLQIWNKSELTKYINDLKDFYFRCCEEVFVEALAETAPVKSLARDLFKFQNEIKTVHLFVITDAVLSIRKQEPEINDRGIKFIIHVIDLKTLYEFANNELIQDIIYDFTDPDFSNEVECSGIKCLDVSIPSSGYGSYLAVMSGKTLAILYEKYGSRIMESNVRSYLQYKVKVNRDIRNTIKLAPEKFFAYNNGISAIADAVEVENSSIIKMKNFQIVNGGQTTASIHNAYRDKADVSKIYVQVKISELKADTNDKNEMISKIAKYANSQNKINESDFFSTHPFNLRFQSLAKSNRVPESAPNRRTFWFYERSRGSYATEYNHYVSNKKKMEFKNKYPKNQCIKITELAKYLSVWMLEPYKVSKGAQYVTKCFTDKVTELLKNVQSTESIDTYYNAEYFKQAIAKTIIFRQCDSIVKKATWYTGSYKANIVAYSIAFLAYWLNETKQEINFTSIWNIQDISEAFKETLNDLGEAVLNAILVNAGNSNVTEYCKRKDCWDQIKKLGFNFSEKFIAELNVAGVSEKSIQQARKLQKLDNKLVEEINFYKLTPEQCRLIINDAKKDKFFITEEEKRALNNIMLGKSLSSKQISSLKMLFSRMKANDLPTPDL